MATFVVHADNEELDPVGASSQDVGRQGSGALHGHGLLAAQFEQRHFGRKGPGQRLGMTDQAGRGQGEVVPDLEQLLHAFVGDEVPHGGTVVGTNHDASLEGDTDGAGSRLHDGLVF